ncbi:hypothetical protein AVEN_188292-2-1, partial [Araneus ventricosus]
VVEEADSDDARFMMKRKSRNTVEW